MHDDMEKCHLKQLRFSLGVNKKAPKLAVYGETGRFPLLVEAICNAVKYFLRLADFSVGENELLYHAFVENQGLKIKNSWINNVKAVLKKCDISLSSVHLANPL